MDREIICIDTSLLIDYYRKKDKIKSKLVELSIQYSLCISVITKLEILVGVNPNTIDFWNSVFARLIIMPISDHEVETASEIIIDLKKNNLLIDIRDILIASTAIAHNVKIATLNTKHFQRIKGLELID